MRLDLPQADGVPAGNFQSGAMTEITKSNEHRCFGGVVSYHEHYSEACGAPMRFGIYSPPQAAEGPVPALYFLAGLTSTEENFLVKAGALVRSKLVL